MLVTRKKQRVRRTVVGHSSEKTGLVQLDARVVRSQSQLMTFSENKEFLILKTQPTPEIYQISQRLFLM